MAKYEMRNFYEVLDIEETATEKEIHVAYRKQAKKWHPDICKEPDAVERYQEVMHAYEILMDVEERERYDHLLKTVGKGLGFDELLSKFYFHRQGAHSPVQGESVEMKIYFTASEVLTKVEKTIEFVREANCKDCDGHGYLRDIANMCRVCRGVGHTFIDTNTPFGNIKTEKDCGACEGSGYTQVEECQTCHTKGKVSEEVKITFPIPNGVTEGYRLRIRNKGDAGLNGGKNGDLFIVFRQSGNDSYVIRNRYDLQKEIVVPFETALLGGEITIPLPNGKKVKMPIKRGIKNRNLINIPDGGLYDPERKQHGMFIGILYIDIPTAATDEDAREIFNLLNKEGVPAT